jgi:hypothetical protein
MDASELTASFARLDASRDDIAGVVAFLRDPRVAAHAALQKRGWITLAELMPEPRTGIQTAEAVAALNAGVLAAAVAALRTHRAEEDVQVWAGVALTSLATGFRRKWAAAAPSRPRWRGCASTRTTLTFSNKAARRWRLSRVRALETDIAAALLAH